MNGKPRDMDINFAIKVLRSAKVDTPSMHGNPKRYDYQNQTFYDIARNMGIKALEKQIPKKPIKETYGACKCPVCNDLEVKDYTTGVKFKHCRFCGQALDWGDTE